MTFEQKYQTELARLNADQRRAVEQIDGPVMVLAGPGTGKTQLLSMRVANILQRTDMNPSNILCLTFTNAASINMTKRMSELFGEAAYDVAVFTFHSFAGYIINRFPEYFNDGADFSPVDEITKHELLSKILSDLPHDNPLSKFLDDQPIYLKDTVRAISDIKRAGLLPDELLSVVDENEKFIEFAEPILARFFNIDTPRKHAEIDAYV
ncbi:MAG: UvrD-helicase domain-containing protein, partial [Candidatus Nomurabacteria bacterium]|nr:UvrD-helicase domain-containing protein [Candidatus Nomurabacteria bacterium]